MGQRHLTPETDILTIHLIKNLHMTGAVRIIYDNWRNSRMQRHCISRDKLQPHLSVLWKYNLNIQLLGFHMEEKTCYNVNGGLFSCF